MTERVAVKNYPIRTELHGGATIAERLNTLREQFNECRLYLCDWHVKDFLFESRDAENSLEATRRALRMPSRNAPESASIARPWFVRTQHSLIAGNSVSIYAYVRREDSINAIV